MQEERIRDVLRSYVVEALGISSCTIEPIGGGVCRDNYKVETLQGVYVLHTKVGPFSKQYRASVEYQRYLEGRCFSVAATHGSPCYLQAIDRVVHLCEYLTGEHLSKWSESHAHELGQTLGEMHSLSLEAAGEGIFNERIAEADLPTEKRVSRTKHSVLGAVAYLGAWIRRVPCPSLSSVFQAFYSKRSFLRLLDELPKGYTHGDIQSSNLLFSDSSSEDGEIVGVIDFERANFRALLLDVADGVSLSCLSCRSGEVFSMPNYHAFMRGYESMRKLSAEESRALPSTLDACASRLLLKKVSRWHWHGDAASESEVEEYISLRLLAEAIKQDS